MGKIDIASFSIFESQNVFFYIYTCIIKITELLKSVRKKQFIFDSTSHYVEFCFSYSFIKWLHSNNNISCNWFLSA